MFDERRYTALPIFVVVFRLIGATVILGLIVSLVRLTQTTGDLPPLYGAAVIAGSVLVLMFALVFVAVGELLQVMMDIEENTRKAADDRALESARRRREEFEPVRA